MAVIKSLSLLLPLLLCFTSTFAMLPIDVPCGSTAPCGVCPSTVISPYQTMTPYYSPRWTSPYMNNPMAAMSPYYYGATMGMMNAPYMMGQLQSNQLFNQMQSNQLFNQQQANQLFQHQQSNQAFNQLEANQLFNQLQSNQMFNQQQANQMMMMDAQMMGSYLMRPMIRGGCCPGPYAAPLANVMPMVA